MKKLYIVLVLIASLCFTNTVSAQTHTGSLSGSGGVDSLGDVFKFNISSFSTGQFLYYDGTNVVNTGAITTDGTDLTLTGDIVVPTGNALDINLGTASGDNFTIDTTAVVYQGNNGNVGINTASFGASGANELALGNGTIGSAAADMVQLAAQDYATGDSRLYIQGESGGQIILGGGKMVLPQVSTETAPTFAFGDGDSGFYEEGDDEIRITLGENWTFNFISDATNRRFTCRSTGTAALLNEAPSATNPVYSFNDDFDTGISRNAVDQISLIAGEVEGIRTTESGGTITNRLSDKVSVSNTAESNTGSLNIQTTREVHTLSLAATSDTTTISVPSGALILGASFNVNTAVTDDAGDDTWSAAFITGDTSTLATGAAAAQDTKVDTSLVPVKTTATTQIRFTPNAGNFSAGVIEVQVYYIDLTSLASV